MFAICQPWVELMPGVQSLPRPDPETRGDAHYECHQVLDHVDSEVWRHTEPGLHRAGDGQALAVVADPTALPVGAEGLLVEEAGDNNGGRDGVEHAEYSDPHHQTLQLLCLGAVVFHDGADSEQWHKAGQQERRPDEEINKEGGQHKAPQRIQVA